MRIVCCCVSHFDGGGDATIRTRSRTGMTCLTCFLLGTVISACCCARIAAGSVVLDDVPPRTTMAGVPARVVGEAGCAQPSLTMDHLIRGEI